MKWVFYSWCIAVICLLSELIRYFFFHKTISIYFLPSLLIFLLPLWIYLYEKIRHTYESTTEKASFIPIIASFVLCIFIAMILSPNVNTLLCILLFLLSIFRVLEYRILFLLSMLAVFMMPIFWALWLMYGAEALFVLSYVSFFLGVAASIIVPYRWWSVLEKNLQYTPKWWSAYIGELLFFAKKYVEYIHLIFVITIAYIFIQDPTWIITLHSSVPLILTIFLYIAVTITLAPATYDTSYWKNLYKHISLS